MKLTWRQSLVKGLSRWAAVVVRGAETEQKRESGDSKFDTTAVNDRVQCGQDKEG